MNRLSPFRGVTKIDEHCCGVVVVAHAPLASAMVSAACEIVGEPATIGVVAIDIDSTELAAGSKLEDAVTAVRQDRGVVIMTDLFGGTAANLALSHLGDGDVEVVSGINLAMLVDLLLARTPTADATDLVAHASAAARKSVVVASELLGSPAGHAA